MPPIYPMLLPLQLILAAEGLTDLKCRSDGKHSLQISENRTAWYRCAGRQPEGGYSIISPRAWYFDEGVFRSGVLIGKRRVNQEGGGKHTELNYRNGRLFGKIVYFQPFSGKLAQESNFRNDQLTGTITLYSGIGNWEEERTIKRGIANGVAISSSARKPPFKRDIKFSWRDGMLHGDKKFFDANGKILKKLSYDSGRLITADIPTSGIKVEALADQSINTGHHVSWYRSDYSDLPQALSTCRPSDEKKSKNKPFFVPIHKTDIAWYRCANGLPDGPIQIQSARQSDREFGMLKFTGTLTAGKLTGPYSIYRYGTAIESGRYFEGKRHGEIRFYRDGELFFERPYDSGKPGATITYFNRGALEVFNAAMNKRRLVKKRAADLKNAICDSSAVTWDVEKCMHRSRGAGDKAAAIKILEVGCDQKISPACLELGVLIEDESRRQKLWGDTCSRDFKTCIKYANALVSLGRADLVFDLLMTACRGRERQAECRNIDAYKAFKNFKPR